MTKYSIVLIKSDILNKGKTGQKLCTPKNGHDGESPLQRSYKDRWIPFIYCSLKKKNSEKVSVVIILLTWDVILVNL